MTNEPIWSGEEFVRMGTTLSWPDTVDEKKACQYQIDRVSYPKKNTDANNLIGKYKEPKPVIFNSFYCKKRSDGSINSTEFLDFEINPFSFYKKADGTIVTGDEEVLELDDKDFTPITEAYDLYNAQSGKIPTVYRVKDGVISETTNEPVNGSWGKKIGDTFYVFDKYLNTDQSRQNYTYMKDNKEYRTSDDYLKGDLGSYIIPPHVVIDSFNRTGYMTEKCSGVYDKDAKTFSNAKCFRYDDKDNETLKLHDDKAAMFRLEGTAGLPASNQVTFRKIETDDKNSGEIDRGQITITLKDTGNYGYKRGNYINKTEENNKGKADGVDNVNYLSRAFMSGMAMRKMPWIRFLLKCATGADGYGRDICKNYTNYYKLTPEEQKKTVTAEISDADQFMMDYCLTDSNGKTYKYNDKDIGKVTSWKYDNNGKYCKCMRDYPNATEKLACSIKSCTSSNDQYWHNYLRTTTDRGCSTQFNECTSNVTGTGSSNAEVGKVYNITNCNNDPQTAETQNALQDIKKDLGKSRKIGLGIMVVLVLLLILVVIVAIIMVVVIGTKKSPHTNMSDHSYGHPDRHNHHSRHRDRR